MGTVLTVIGLILALYIGARLVFYAWFYTKKTFDKENENDKERET